MKQTHYYSEELSDIRARVARTHLDDTRRVRRDEGSAERWRADQRALSEVPTW